MPHHYAACVGLARGLCQIASGDKDAPTVATLVAWEQWCPPKIAPSTEPVADITRLSKRKQRRVDSLYTELTALMAEAAGVKPVKPEPVPPPGPADGECDELKREITRVWTRLNRTHAAWVDAYPNRSEEPPQILPAEMAQLRLLTNNVFGAFGRPLYQILGEDFVAPAFARVSSTPMPPLVDPTPANPANVVPLR